MHLSEKRATVFKKFNYLYIMRGYLIICFFTFAFLTNAQNKWSNLGPDQDSTFLNQQSPGDETNSLNSIESAPDGTLYRLYQKYCNSNPCNSPLTVLKLTNNKWLPIGSNFFSIQPPAFKLDNTGTPFLATLQYNYISCYKFTNNNWQSVGSFSFTNYSNVSFKIKFDKTNIPYILYSSSADSNKLTLKKLAGNNWVSVGQDKFAPCVKTANPYYDKKFSNNFDFSLDSNFNVYVGSIIKNTNNSKLNIYKFNGTGWQLQNSLAAVNNNTVANYVSLQCDNYYTPYCCYLDSNNKYSILSGLQTSLNTVFSYRNSNIDELKFMFDTLNTLVPYTVFHNDSADSPSGYRNYLCKWTGNLQAKQLIGNSLLLDLNTNPYFIITPKYKCLIDLWINQNLLSWTTLLLNPSTNIWQLLGDNEAGVINTRTDQSTIKFDKAGVMYICFTDNINSGAVSVLKYKNNNFSLVGSQNITNGEPWFWQFELDNNGAPMLAYANVSDTNNVLVKRFDGINWIRLGNINFRSNWIDQRPQLFYDRNNKLYIYNYNGVKDENTIHEFIDNEWNLITGADWRFAESSLSGLPFLTDTNNVINSVFGTSQNNDCGNAIQKFNTAFTPDYNTCTKEFLSDFAIDKTTNIPYTSWVENSSNGKSHIQKFIKGKWVSLGDTIDPPVWDYNYNSTHLILDSLGNPYYLTSSSTDTNHISLYYLKNNQWKRLGNTRVSNYQALNYNGAIYNNKFYVIYANKGAWIRTIDLPALASINSAIDTCFDNTAKINVNISNALNYQWQVNTGNGFINISDNSVYSGAENRQLNIHTNLSDLSQQQFRCVVLKSSGYNDTTNYIRFSCHYSDSIKAIPPLILFPNPTSSIFTIEAKKNISGYEVIDVLGKVLVSQTPNLLTRINVDVSAFSAGVYYVQVNYGNNEKKVFKLLKE